MPLLLGMISSPSPSPSRRRAVLLVLAVMSSGCADAYASTLPRLMPVVYAGCEAPEAQVRTGAGLLPGNPCVRVRGCGRVRAP
jgi:hypothetical protein